MLQGGLGFQKGSKGIQAGDGAHSGVRELAGGCYLWGGEKQVRSQLELTVPGTHVPGPELTSLIALLHGGETLWSPP